MTNITYLVRKLTIYLLSSEHHWVNYCKKKVIPAGQKKRQIIDISMYYYLIYLFSGKKRSASAE
ncbi:MAG: hypothetical protein ACJAYB_003409 [Psychromonas sp.]|jgi:hypothetical protein